VFTPQHGVNRLSSGGVEGFHTPRDRRFYAINGVKHVYPTIHFPVDYSLLDILLFARSAPPVDYSLLDILLFLPRRAKRGAAGLC